MHARLTIARGAIKMRKKWVHIFYFRYNVILMGMNKILSSKELSGDQKKPLPAAAKRSAALKPAHPAVNDVEDIRDAVSKLKRERIIAVAVDLFYNQGFNNTTLEAVAEKINVTKPFIYSHFKSKNDLLAEICARGIRASLEVLNQVVALDSSPTDKVRALMPRGKSSRRGR